MIIVNQDKDKIVNFDNLTQIYITQDEEETAYFIRFETVDSLYDDLGKYKTKERVKEVLQEIVKVYANGKTADEGNTFFGGFSWIPADTLYEMPKE